MTLLTVVCSLLFGVISPLSISTDSLGEIAAAEVGEAVVVAYLPSNVASHEKRVTLLEGEAARVASETGKAVFLTDDLRSYLSLKRIEQRGADEYERRTLASRLVALRGELYPKSPTPAAKSVSERS